MNKPLIGVNHLAGHALTPRLTDGLDYPYVMLLVSGGHCQFLQVSGPQDFIRIGGTIDDAPGEAVDKVARIMGLPQPGGPSVEKEAKSGDATRFALPRPLLDREGAICPFQVSKPPYCVSAINWLPRKAAFPSRTAPIFAPVSKPPCGMFWLKNRAAR